MDMERAREIFTNNPPAAIRLAEKLGVSRSLISSILSGANKQTGVVGKRVAAAIIRKAIKLETESRKREN